MYSISMPFLSDRRRPTAFQDLGRTFAEKHGNTGRLGASSNLQRISHKLDIRHWTLMQNVHHSGFVVNLPKTKNCHWIIFGTCLCAINASTSRITSKGNSFSKLSVGSIILDQHAIYLATCLQMVWLIYVIYIYMLYMYINYRHIYKLPAPK